ncbi:MAG: hypothetical protein RPU52_05575, partial [Candidatus Sedimenticola sp. (ex Thyasira tokunagai)]
MWLTVFITLLQAQTVSPTLREALIAFFPEISNQNHLTNPLPSTFHLNYHLLKYLTLASTSPQIPPDFLSTSSKPPHGSPQETAYGEFISPDKRKPPTPHTGRGFSTGYY